MKKITKITALFLALILGLSAFSVITPLAAEKRAEITKLYAGTNSIKLQWNKVEGVKTYDIYRYSIEVTNWEKIGSVSSTSYTDKNVHDGIYYTYAIDVGSYQFGNEKSLTFLKAPKIISATANSKGIVISWEKTDNANSYDICRKTEGGKYKKIGSVTRSKTSFTDKNAKNCVKYTYAVRAVKGLSKSTYSKVTKTAQFVKAPTLVYVKNSPQGVTVRWKKSAAPQKYEIFRSTGKGWAKAGTVSSDKISFVDKKVAYGKNNFYKVRAISGEDKSYCSKKLSVLALDPKKPTIALTWDDGPYTPVTNQILDTLEKYNSRATFFIVGSRADTYKDCIKREVKLGCEVATHTYNHASLTRLSPEEIKKEISTGIAAIEKYSGKGSVKLCRTPGGAVNDTVRQNIGLPMINWSVDTLDWQHRTTSKTVSNIKSQVKDGSIVLMHDLYVPTGNAAVEIIPWLISQGYQLVTVSELFELKGITPQAGQLYTHG